MTRFNLPSPFGGGLGWGLSAHEMCKFGFFVTPVKTGG
jgi:hypothetical protein